MAGHPQRHLRRHALIAVDTQLLVYAHRADSPFHSAAAARMRSLCLGTVRFALPMQALAEFYAVVTHPRIYRPPSTPAQAVAQVHAWTESPACVVIFEGPSAMARLWETAEEAKITGPMVHDARIVATCLAEGVSTLWSADRDLSRFPSLRTENPVVG